MKNLRSNRAFTLVEMTLIVVMIGVTLLFAIPRVEAQQEVPVASKGFRFMYRLEGAQNHFHRKNGTYASHIEVLGIVEGVPNEFALLELSSDDWTTNWTATLARHTRWCSFGPYQIIFNEAGFQPEMSSVCDALVPDGGRFGPSVPEVKP